mmetsp:Transcript_13417/g.34345  ORF Transcript_13417/g.34345 Transcript_13417/m.34345 type:complete len:877 (+) Transcript_13417:24-2654(+)
MAGELLELVGLPKAALVAAEMQLEVSDLFDAAVLCSVNRTRWITILLDLQISHFSEEASRLKYLLLLPDICVDPLLTKYNRILEVPDEAKPRQLNQLKPQFIERFGVWGRPTDCKHQAAQGLLRFGGWVLDRATGKLTLPRDTSPGAVPVARILHILKHDRRGTPGKCTGLTVAATNPVDVNDVRSSVNELCQPLLVAEDGEAPEPPFHSACSFVLPSAVQADQDLGDEISRLAGAEWHGLPWIPSGGGEVAGAPSKASMRLYPMPPDTDKQDSLRTLVHAAAIGMWGASLDGHFEPRANDALNMIHSNPLLYSLIKFAKCQSQPLFYSWAGEELQRLQQVAQAELSASEKEHVRCLTVDCPAGECNKIHVAKGCAEADAQRAIVALQERFRALTLGLGSLSEAPNQSIAGTANSVHILANVLRRPIIVYADPSDKADACGIYFPLVHKRESWVSARPLTIAAVNGLFCALVPASGATSVPLYQTVAGKLQPLPVRFYPTRGPGDGGWRGRSTVWSKNLNALDHLNDLLVPKKTAVTYVATANNRVPVLQLAVLEEPLVLEQARRMSDAFISVVKTRVTALAGRRAGSRTPPRTPPMPPSQMRADRAPAGDDPTTPTRPQPGTAAARAGIADPNITPTRESTQPKPAAPGQLQKSPSAAEVRAAAKASMLAAKLFDLYATPGKTMNEEGFVHMVDDMLAATSGRRSMTFSGPSEMGIVLASEIARLMPLAGNHPADTIGAKPFKQLVVDEWAAIVVANPRVQAAGGGGLPSPVSLLSDLQWIVKERRHLATVNSAAAVDDDADGTTVRVGSGGSGRTHFGQADAAAGGNAATGLTAQQAKILELTALVNSKDLPQHERSAAGKRLMLALMAKSKRD